MKTIIFIIAVFCFTYTVKAEVDTLKLSNGDPVLLSNGSAVLIGDSEPNPPLVPITGRWLHQANGRKLFFNNGKAILSRD